MNSVVCPLCMAAERSPNPAHAGHPIVRSVPLSKSQPCGQTFRHGGRGRHLATEAVLRPGPGLLSRLASVHGKGAGRWSPTISSARCRDSARNRQRAEKNAQNGRRCPDHHAARLTRTRGDVRSRPLLRHRRRLHDEAHHLSPMPVSAPRLWCRSRSSRSRLPLARSFSPWRCQCQLKTAHFCQLKIAHFRGDRAEG